MKTKTIGGLILGLVASMALGGGQASAGTPSAPEIVDAGGDANFINTQGNVTNQHRPTPGSVAGADIRAIWLETDYEREKVADEAGNTTKIRHVPTALEINIQTEAAPIPSFGPTLIYRVPTQIGRCNVSFEAIVRGPNSLAQDPAQQVRIVKVWDSRGMSPPLFINPTACPGGTGTITNAAFSLTSSGNVLTMRFPFSALPYAPNQLALEKDVVIRRQPANLAYQPQCMQDLIGTGDLCFFPTAQVPSYQSPNPHVKVFTGGTGASVNGFRPVDYPTIDETHPYQAQFRLGEDVPGDIDCTVVEPPAACTA